MRTVASMSVRGVLGLGMLVATIGEALADGGPGNVLHFDGAGGHAVVPATSALIVWPMSVTVWVRTSQTNGGGDILFKMPPPVQGLPFWYLSPSGGVLEAGIERSFADVAVVG